MVSAIRIARVLLLLTLLGSSALFAEVPLNSTDKGGQSYLTIAETGTPANLGYPFATSSPQDRPDSKAGMFGLPKRLTISANMEAAYRSTNFYHSGHNTILFQGDGRVEFWPPGQGRFSWGPYVRVAGLDSNRSEAWENAWMAGPGLGFHMFPFSDRKLRTQAGWLGPVLVPLRLFAEYNRLDYTGPETQWRPDEQIRAGADYWRQRGTHDLKEPLWSETWGGLFWQSANEFDKDYDSTILGGSLRIGGRYPDAGVFSMLSPYLLAESSLTDNRTYYWENRLVGGAGIRFAPPLEWLPQEWQINRLVAFVEYMGVLGYWRDDAPASIPDHDLRAGIGLSIGEWYR